MQYWTQSSNHRLWKYWSSENIQMSTEFQTQIFRNSKKAILAFWLIWSSQKLVLFFWWRLHLKLIYKSILCVPFLWKSPSPCGNSREKINMRHDYETPILELVFYPPETWFAMSNSSKSGRVFVLCKWHIDLLTKIKFRAYNE